MVLDLLRRAAVLVVILLLSCQVGSLLGLLTSRDSPMRGILSFVCLSVLVLRFGSDWYWVRLTGGKVSVSLIHSLVSPPTVTVTRPLCAATLGT